MEDRQCRLCQAPMQAGFLADQTYGGTLQEHWVEGPPRQSIWGSLKMGGTTRYKVITFRCTACGYLESFAIEGA